MTEPPRAEEWLVFVPPPHVEAALQLFCGADIQVAFENRGVWLRLAGHDSAQLSRTRLLPASTYRVTDGRWLALAGHAVACRTVPRLDWCSISEMVELVLPPLGWGASRQAIEPIRLRLTPAAHEISARAGLFDLTEMSGWVETAPQLRLRRLRYTVNQSTALVEGHPLPPIRCQQFLGKYANIYVPLGSTWTPGVEAAVVAKTFGLAENELLVWQADDVWSILSEHHFIGLSRSSLRALSGGWRGH